MIQNLIWITNIVNWSNQKFCPQLNGQIWYFPRIFFQQTSWTDLNSALLINESMYCIDLYCTYITFMSNEAVSTETHSTTAVLVYLINVLHGCSLPLPTLCPVSCKGISEEQLFLLHCQHLRLRCHKEVEPSFHFTCTSKTDVCLWRNFCATERSYLNVWAALNISKLWYLLLIEQWFTKEYLNLLSVWWPVLLYLLCLVRNWTLNAQSSKQDIFFEKNKLFKDYNKWLPPSSFT